MTPLKFRQCLNPLPPKVKILDTRKITLTLSSHQLTPLKEFCALYVYIF